MKNKFIAKNKWYIVIITISIILFVGIAYLVYNTTVNPIVSYSWEDHSGGELNIVRGTYKGKSSTFYLHDDMITEYNSLSVSFSNKVSGSISFYFRYENDVNGEVSMDFYSGAQIFSIIQNAQNSIMSSTWYSVVLTFDCTSDTGEIWIDGILIQEGQFNVRDADYCNGFVIRTSVEGMIDGYISGLSIS